MSRTCDRRRNVERTKESLVCPRTFSGCSRLFLPNDNSRESYKKWSDRKFGPWPGVVVLTAHGWSRTTLKNACSCCFVYIRGPITTSWLLHLTNRRPEGVIAGNLNQNWTNHFEGGQDKWSVTFGKACALVKFFLSPSARCKISSCFGLGELGEDVVHAVIAHVPQGCCTSAAAAANKQSSPKVM